MGRASASSSTMRGGLSLLCHHERIGVIVPRTVPRWLWELGPIWSISRYRVLHFRYISGGRFRYIQNIVHVYLLYLVHQRFTMIILDHHSEKFRYKECPFR